MQTTYFNLLSTKKEPRAFCACFPLVSMKSILMLNCLFAMVFAAATIGFLSCLGVAVRSSAKCPVMEGDLAGVYSGCEMWQDLRSILSFLLGAGLCMLLQSCSENQDCHPEAVIQDDEPGKMQLSACLL